MAESDNESGGGGGAANNTSNANQVISPREQDRFLPIANVSRIMKKALPANAKISKDAKEIVQECVSEFISFVTGEASDKCQREKRKTINGDDLLWAMTTLGFEQYVEPLKVYLQKFREMEGEKNAVVRDNDIPGNRVGFALDGYAEFKAHVYGPGGGGVFNQSGAIDLRQSGGSFYGGPGSTMGRPS